MKEHIALGKEIIALKGDSVWGLLTLHCQLVCAVWSW
jgi:hypothetical protein